MCVYLVCDCLDGTLTGLVIVRCHSKERKESEFWSYMYFIYRFQKSCQPQTERVVYTPMQEGLRRMQSRISPYGEVFDDAGQDVGGKLVITGTLQEELSQTSYPASQPARDESNSDLIRDPKSLVRCLSHRRRHSE